MLKTPDVTAGQWVKRGDLLGFCGTTGDSTGAHAHYDIPLKNLGPRWTAYVNGMSRAEVRSLYADPTPFIKGDLPMKAEFPLLGFTYLQPVRGPKGVYYHSGIDLNGVNDLGKPLYSPVEGRVIKVCGQPNKKLTKAEMMNLNSGWGNFVVIEESPNFKL